MRCIICGSGRPRPEAAAAADFEQLKLNAVLLRGINDDEASPLIRFGQAHGMETRFIEYMPFGSSWRRFKAVTASEILASIQEDLGEPTPLTQLPGATAQRYRLEDGSTFGIIRTLSAPFCGHCDRVRLTADGRLLPCLFATHGPSVRQLLRGHVTPHGLRDAIARCLETKGRGFLATARHTLDMDTPQPGRDMKALGG